MGAIGAIGVPGMTRGTGAIAVTRVTGTTGATGAPIETENGKRATIGSSAGGKAVTSGAMGKRATAGAVERRIIPERRSPTSGPPMRGAATGMPGTLMTIAEVVLAESPSN